MEILLSGKKGKKKKGKKKEGRCGYADDDCWVFYKHDDAGLQGSGVLRPLQGCDRPRKSPWGRAPCPCLTGGSKRRGREEMELRQPLVKQLTSCAGTGLLTLPDKSACGNSLGVCADEYLLFPTPTATASCIYLEKGVNFFSPPGTIGPGEKPHSQSRLLSSFHDPLPPLPGTGSWRLHCLLLIPSGLKLCEPWPQRRRAPGGERAGGSARGSGDVGGGSGKENIELGVKTSEANREGKKGRVLTTERRPGGDGAV